MGFAVGYNRVVMKVAISEEEQAAFVKKRLEESGIIYAEEDGEVCFSVLPVQRKEDFHRVKEILLSASR